jgi:PIN domain nuclease of toxin-antitoxin system
MRLLLDSHVVIRITLEQLQRTYRAMAQLLADPANEALVSTASLWEIAIKARLGKLHLGTDVRNLPRLLRRGGMSMLSVSERHAVALLSPEPSTKDPFDRMLLTQCQVEGLQLLTADRALAGHPLAWRA